MNDPLLVRGGDCIGELKSHVHRAGGIQAPLACEHEVERLAPNQLHHQEDGSIGRLPEICHLDDSGVADPARCASLAQEPFCRLRATRGADPQHLDGNLLTKVDVLAAVHDAHRAAPQDFVKLVEPDGVTGAGFG